MTDPLRPSISPAQPDLDDDEAHAGDLVGFVAAEEAIVEETPSKGPLLRRLSALAGPLVRFALVGGVGFAIETLVFNALLFTVLTPQTVAGAEIWAKIPATLIAIFTNWIGNRLWTFRHDRRTDRATEGAEFFAVSLAGLVVGLIPMWVTTQALGIQPGDDLGAEYLIAVNVANVVGLVLGSIFRFACYRFWVFSPRRRGSAARRRDASEARIAGARMPGADEASPSEVPARADDAAS